MTPENTGVAVSSKKKKQLTQNPFLECKVQMIYQDIRNTLGEGDGGLRLYLKFSRKIIALSQNVWGDLIHMQSLFQTNYSRQKRACGRDDTHWKRPLILPDTGGGDYG